MTERPIPTPKEMHDHLLVIMRGVNAQLFQALGNQVVYGPFKGMTIERDPYWEDGNASTKLLGCYEFELFGVIAKLLERKPKTIINIGCAEGYYAVGFATLLPDVTVYAMDIDECSLWECRHAAIANGVADRMQFFKGCHYAKDLEVDAPVDGRLYFVDCEGNEEKLLDKTQCPALVRSDIIVECHEFMFAGITQKLADRFLDTHEVVVIEPQLPPFDRYPFLAASPAVMNLLAITEKRPMPTRWLACWAH